MGEVTQNGQLLSDVLANETPKPSDVLQWMAQLNDQIQGLHATGRLHREVRSDKIWIDARRNATLQPATAGPISCGEAHEPNRMPPELELIDELKLPDRIDLVRDQFKSHDAESCDPCRIDIYQLGVLGLNLLTGTSVSQYLVDPTVKAAVPPRWQTLIDSAIGYSPTQRLQNGQQLKKMLDDLSPTNVNQGDSPTPAMGTGVDIIRDTPASGNVAADDPISTPKEQTGDEGSNDQSNLPFEQLGQYRIDGPLGSGGMGDVYRAYDPRLDRNVAIKVLPAELSRNEQFVERFASEARAVAKLTHPHIVPVYNIGHDQGHHFFVMELVEGQSLAQLLRQRGKLSTDSALELVQQVASGLAEAHRHGLIHRDIKPSNILLSKQTDAAKLADFGLVKSLHSNVQGTATGIVMGTVDYIAPEQGQGKPVDGRADLYSLGVLLYRMISGRLPFVADSPTAMIFQHAYEQPTALHEVVPTISPTVEALINRLMSKNPDDRYQTGQELIKAIEKLKDPRATAFQSAVTGSFPKQSEIIFAPEFEEPPQDLADPSEREYAAPIDQGLNTRAFALFNEHAPAALRDLQNTEQHVAGGIAVYVGRRNQLAELLNEAIGVEKELSQRIAENQTAATSAARRIVEARDAEEKENAKALQSQHLETVEVLKQQLAVQKEQRIEMDDRLVQVDSTLESMRSQQQQLLARLEKARATTGAALGEKTSEAAGSLNQTAGNGLAKLVAGVLAAALTLAMLGIFWWAPSVKPATVGLTGSYQQQVQQRIAGKEFWLMDKEGAMEADSRIVPLPNGKWQEGDYSWETVGYESNHIVLYDSSRDYFGQIFDHEFRYQSPGYRERNAWKSITGKWSGFGTGRKISAVNSTSKAYGYTRTVTYAGQKMEVVVDQSGASRAGVYFLDRPADVATVGEIAVNAPNSKLLNGVGIYATALVGTADGKHEFALGKLGDPYATINIANKNAYVLAVATSNDLSTRIPSRSPNSIVSVDAPFAEVGNYNGHGNEIGSALAATAEFHTTEAGEFTATFPGLSNRHNRELVVIAAFAAAETEKN